MMQLSTQRIESAQRISSDEFYQQTEKSLEPVWGKNKLIFQQMTPHVLDLLQKEQERTGVRLSELYRDHNERWKILLGGAVFGFASCILARIFGRSVFVLTKETIRLFNETSKTLFIARRLQVLPLAREGSVILAWLFTFSSVTLFAISYFASLPFRKAKCEKQLKEIHYKIFCFKHPGVIDQEKKISYLRFSKQDLEYGRIFLQTISQKHWEQDRNNLGISSSEEEIHKRYKLIQLKTHPDKNPNLQLREQYQKRWTEFKELSAFYDELERRLNSKKFKDHHICSFPMNVTSYIAVQGIPFPLSITQDLVFS